MSLVIHNPYPEQMIGLKSADVDSTIYPKERIYNPLVQPDEDGDVCSTFCSYDDPKPNIRTLEKEGTSDVLPNDASLCEPCGDSCEKVPIVCTVSETVPFATGPTDGSYNYLEKITYSCNIGYEMQSGDLERICQDDGTWSGIPPVCAPIVCIVPETVNFSTGPTDGSYNYLDKITYSCNRGYEVQSGDLERSCQDEKTWSGSPPVCAPIVCIVPETVDFATGPADGSYNYLDKITYSCNTGYEVQSGNLERICLKDKTWSGSPLVCTQIVCVVPKTVEFAIGPTDGSYNYMETIAYSCIPGYEIQSGDLERTCQADGTWCGIPPVCVPVSCTDPGNGQFTKENPVSSYIFRDSVTYTCLTGYEVQYGDLERSCQADGTWSGNPPVCKISLKYLCDILFELMETADSSEEESDSRSSEGSYEKQTHKKDKGKKKKLSKTLILKICRNEHHH